MHDVQGEVTETYWHVLFFFHKSELQQAPISSLASGHITLFHHVVVVSAISLWENVLQPLHHAHAKLCSLRPRARVPLTTSKHFPTQRPRTIWAEEEENNVSMVNLCPVGLTFIARSSFKADPMEHLHTHTHTHSFHLSLTNISRSVYLHEKRRTSFRFMTSLEDTN